MSQRTWQFHDTSSHSGWSVIGDGGVRVVHLHSRTDGPERVSAYRYEAPTVRFEFDVVERGNPKLVNPSEVIFVFPKDIGEIVALTSAGSTQELKEEIIDAITTLERAVSNGGRDYSSARILTRERA